jgi:hypothetical protein
MQAELPSEHSETVGYSSSVPAESSSLSDPGLLSTEARTRSITSPPDLSQTNYRNRWNNKNGSYRYSLELGGGSSFAVGPTRRYQNISGSFRLGTGYNLNKIFGIMLEYDFNNFGVPTGAVNSLYGTPPYYAPTNITGRVHLWSITANPIFHFYNGEQSGAYLVVGGGFYRKLIRFNYRTPSNCSNCLSAPSLYDQSSNNAGGLNAGLGFTRTLSYGSKAKWFAEARGVWIDNNRTTGKTGYPGYPSPTNYRTVYFPATLGMRW